jgi:prepilin-type N-terminal cleavage/methylation domain-containing protein
MLTLGGLILKRAFTLIELLVVIAIIAILAAILFPVFAQAKEAAKKTASLSNCKQVGTAINVYLADSDDLFPNTNMVNYSSGTYIPGTVADTPANWRSNNSAWVNMMSTVYPNNVLPYTKNTQIQEATGAPTESTWASATPTASRLAKTSFNTMTMNGFLSSLSSSSVNEVSRIPLAWYGLGKQRVEGYGLSNPLLLCPSVSAATNPCVFSPAGGPGGATFGMSVPNATSAYVHTGGQIYVHTDSSAKFARLANPNTQNNLTYVDPYANYDANGVGSFYYGCATTSGGISYSCIFRPDFDFNYNNWF